MATLKKWNGSAWENIYTTPSFHTHNFYTEVGNRGEAFLTNGGMNLSSRNSPVDMALIPRLGANRFAFMPADAITVEYSTDNGETWLDYGASDLNRIMIFSDNFDNYNFYLGKADTHALSKIGNGLKITVDVGKGNLYTYLTKFLVFISAKRKTTIGTITLYKYTGVDGNGNKTYSSEVISEDINLSGDIGQNIINIPETIVGGYSDSIVGRTYKIEFKFMQTSDADIYASPEIRGIQAYGGIAWRFPSNMARDGKVYNLDHYQNAIFPSGISTNTLVIRTNIVYLQNITNSGFLKYNSSGILSVDTKEYLPLTGGTLTGPLICVGEKRVESYDDLNNIVNTGRYAINLRNSDIVGLNAIYFADAMEYPSEGLQFYRDGEKYDSFWGYMGKLYFTPERTLGNMELSQSTTYEVITSKNKLKFVGGQTETWDGTENVSVEIPKITPRVISGVEIATVSKESLYSPKYTIYTGLNNNTLSNSIADNGNVYLKLFENTTKNNSINILGDKGITVSSDTSGKITVSHSLIDNSYTNSTSTALSSSKGYDLNTRLTSIETLVGSATGEDSDKVINRLKEVYEFLSSQEETTLDTILKTKAGAITFQGTDYSCINGKIDIGSPSWESITNKPSSYTPSYHSHNFGNSEITNKFESFLTFGGNLAGLTSPVDMALIPRLGANRFAFMPADAITVEYSTDNGETWLDYGASDEKKTRLFMLNEKESFFLGKNTGVPSETHQLRVSIDITKAKIYGIIDKIYLYISTSGTQNCTVEFQGMRNSGTEYETIVEPFECAGWGGPNILNIRSRVTVDDLASRESTFFKNLRFLFKQGTVNASYRGFTINSIGAFGMRWYSTSSIISDTGVLYRTNWEQKAFFPNTVSATAFLEGETLLSNKYAPKTNPTFTGTVTLPTSTKIGNLASTGLVKYTNGVLSVDDTEYATKGDMANYKIKVVNSMPDDIEANTIYYVLES